MPLLRALDILDQILRFSKVLLIHRDARLLVFDSALLVNGRLRRVELCGFSLRAGGETGVVHCVAVTAGGAHRKLLIKVRIIACHRKFGLIVFDVRTLELAILNEIFLGLGLGNKILCHFGLQRLFLRNPLLLSLLLLPVGIELPLLCVLLLLVSLQFLLTLLFLALLTFYALGSLLTLLSLALPVALGLHDPMKVVLLYQLEATG